MMKPETEKTHVFCRNTITAAVFIIPFFQQNNTFQNFFSKIVQNSLDIKICSVIIFFSNSFLYIVSQFLKITWRESKAMYFCKIVQIDPIRKIILGKKIKFENFWLFSALAIANCFGLFPVNINHENPQKINFKWASPRTFVSIVFIICSSLTTCCILKAQTEKGPLTTSNIIGIVFYLSCTIIFILFFKIAQNFGLLIVKWSKTESYFMTAAYTLPSKSWSLKKRILTVTFIYLTVSFLEHFLFVISDITVLVEFMEFCKLNETNYVEILIRRQFSFLLKNLPLQYNHALGFILEYLNFSYTFSWNFLDLFIILISIGISFLYEKLNCRLNCYTGLLVNEEVWSEMRFHYVKVCELLYFINRKMGEIIIISSFIDGYFILMQLLNITA